MGSIISISTTWTQNEQSQTYKALISKKRNKYLDNRNNTGPRQLVQFHKPQVTFPVFDILHFKLLRSFNMALMYLISTEIMMNYVHEVTMTTIKIIHNKTYGNCVLHNTIIICHSHFGLPLDSSMSIVL